MLLRTERRMLRMIVGVTLRDREKVEDLHRRLGVTDDIVIEIRKSRLRWFGHIYRRGDDVGIKRAFNLKVQGVVGRGRPGKSWYEVVKRDLLNLGLSENMALDRVSWKNAIKKVPAYPRFRGKEQ